MGAVLVWLLLVSQASAQTTPAAEVQALEAFYNATGGARWISKRNWMSGDPCGSWVTAPHGWLIHVEPWWGVTCTNATNNVTSNITHVAQLYAA